MDGTPGYPEGFSGLPQDEAPELRPNNHFLLGNGRIDQGEVDKCSAAFQGIEYALKCIEAYMWALGDRKLAEHLGEALKEQVQEHTHRLKADLDEAVQYLEHRG